MFYEGNNPIWKWTNLNEPFSDSQSNHWAFIVIHVNGIFEPSLFTFLWYFKRNIMKFLPDVAPILSALTEKEKNSVVCYYVRFGLLQKY